MQSEERVHGTIPPRRRTTGSLEPSARVLLERTALWTVVKPAPLAKVATMVVMSAGNEERTTIIRAAFLAAEMRRRREGFEEALIRSVREEDLRPPLGTFVHDA